MKLAFVNYRREDLPDFVWDELSAVSCQLLLLTDEELRARIAEFDGILLKLGATFDKDMFSQATKATFVGMLGTGYGRIDIDSAAKQNVSVFNVSDYATQAVTEFTIAAIINQLRDLAGAREQVSNGNYDEPAFVGTELASKKVGIIGAGDIGSAVATCLKNGFDSDVVYWSRTQKPELHTTGVVFKELESVFSTCDVVSLHTSLNNETEGLVSAALLQSMKQGSILINTSPMELIDTDGLEKLLDKEKINFIMDHPDEIPVEQVEKLRSFSTCMVYPPLGYLTQEASGKKYRIFLDNILAAVKGEPLPNVVK